MPAPSYRLEPVSQEHAPGQGDRRLGDEQQQEEEAAHVDLLDEEEERERERGDDDPRVGGVCGSRAAERPGFRITEIQFTAGANRPTNLADAGRNVLDLDFLRHLPGEVMRGAVDERPDHRRRGRGGWRPPRGSPR